MRTAAIIGLSLILTSCQRDDALPGYDALKQHVEEERVGSAPDHWIEMRSLSGEWEKTGLIFQYEDDYEECQKAIAVLKEANYAREYRCTPAN